MRAIEGLAYRPAYIPTKEEITMGTVKVELGEERSKQVRHYQAELKKRGEDITLVEAVERLAYAGYSRFIAGRKYRKSPKGQKVLAAAQKKMAKERKSLKAKPKAKPAAAKKAKPTKNGVAATPPATPAQAQSAPLE